MTTPPLHDLFYVAHLPLAQVAATSGHSLYYCAGWAVGYSGDFAIVHELPYPSKCGSVEIAEFGTGKLDGQRWRRAETDAADTAVLVRDTAGTGD